METMRTKDVYKEVDWHVGFRPKKLKYKMAYQYQNN